MLDIFKRVLKDLVADAPSDLSLLSYDGSLMSTITSCFCLLNIRIFLNICTLFVCMHVCVCLCAWLAIVDW